MRDRVRRTITLTQSHTVQQVLQRFDFMWSSPQSTPLSTGHSLSAPPSDKSVEPSGPYPELVGCLMYLLTCTRPDLAYPLSLLAHYVAPGRYRKELCWLTYLLTDLGERPRSPPVLYHCGQIRLAYVATRANIAYVFTKALGSSDRYAVAVGAARGTPRPPFFEGCSPSPLAPSYASTAAANVSVTEDVGAASASAKRRSSKGKGDRGGGGGSGGGGGGSGSGGGGSSGGGASGGLPLAQQGSGR
ncbi:unnamed protein product [Closterium sp. NIES-53]